MNTASDQMPETLSDHQPFPGKARSQGLLVSFGGYSSAGVKAVNQDAFAAAFPDNSSRPYKGAAAAIADGVSSCTDAAIASHTSVTSFMQDYFSTPDSWSVKQSSARVLNALNSWLYQHKAAEQPSLLTTFAAVIIKSTTLYTLHVGDSRISHIRNGRLEQLSEDHQHTELQHTYLARALGADPHLKVDFSCQSLQAGDLILLTTDGVHEYLDNSEISQIIQQHSQPESFTASQLEDIARILVKTALQQGSKDNLTALLVSVTQLPDITQKEAQQAFSHLPIPPALNIGQKIDHYQVLDIVFSGTRSHMYKVKNLHDGQSYVLKSPSLNFADDPHYLQGFIREEWTGQTVQQAHLMRTYAAPDKPFLYYIGEHIEGLNLRQWMDQHPFPTIHEVRQILRQTISGLRALQRQGIIHQDLKPENIMINQDGQVKIIDYGTVQIAGVNELYSPLTKSVPQGSVGYTAPEYLLGQSGSSRSDLFSLAIISYEMLTGKHPYSQLQKADNQLRQYSQLSYTPARQHRPDLPAWIEACLQKALKPDPAERHQALSEFLHDFSTPNLQLVSQLEQQPLLSRNPLLFWQALSGVLLFTNFVLLALS
ncbi:bifunctional protein-serine/threonine kinase/phosphatase [Aliamphritea ceti]|uniref:bifunctional protein-serine/threonine kinase/phosphatase n=1 Tax=Aliamphritea ceti TaxID=1524258 RepID=UPI0021C434A6|nr:bifunctional protein-serine/threonine kinase/phosphatase [Aliamphritea ceti]